MQKNLLKVKICGSRLRTTISGNKKIYKNNYAFKTTKKFF